jgi:hypothetical protein
MVCTDRQLTQAQLDEGFQQQRAGVVRAIRPFSGEPTAENLIDYINRELFPALKQTREALNSVFLQVTDNAPSANPLAYYFSTSTVNADPTSGRLRLNASPQNTATALRLSELNAQLQSTVAWLDVMQGSSTTPLGVVTLNDRSNPGRFIRWNLDTMTDQGTYWDLGVTVVESSHDDPFVEGEPVVVSFIAGVASGGTTVPATGLSPIADDTFLANISGGAAAPTAVPLATLAGAGLTGGANAVLDVGGSTSVIVGADDVQRAALTGFATAAQNSNATTSAEPIITYATSANMSAERVLSNGTNTVVDLGTAGQAQIDVDNFPLSSLADQADDTFLANISGGVAPPTAVALTTLAGAGLTGGADAILAVGAGTRITVNANDVQLATGAAESFLMNATAGVATADYRAGSSVAGAGLTYTAGGTLAVGAGTNVTVNANDVAVTNFPLTGLATQSDDTFLANISGGAAAPTAVALTTLAGAGLTGGADAILNVGAGTHITVNANDVAVNLTTLVPAIDSASVIANGTVLERAALTGPITSAQNSNATSIASSVGGASLAVTSNVIDYVGTTSEIALLAVTGNLGTVSLTGLECGGAVRIAAAEVIGDWQIEGFSGNNTDGFWFQFSAPATDFNGTLRYEDATPTAANRLRMSNGVDVVGRDITAWIAYTGSRWRVVCGGGATTLLATHYADAADASYTITPPGGATWFDIEVCGGGGGGGGADAEAAKEACAGSGGGAGGWFKQRVAIVSGNITGAIGAGGTAGANTGGNGGIGGNSSFSYTGLGTPTALGGGAGVGQSVGPNGNGQLVVTRGAAGGVTLALGNENADGGSGNHGFAFSVSAFNNCAAGGTGGNSVRGGGGRGGTATVDDNVQAGSAARAPGAGGGGGAALKALAGAQTGAAGGAGAPGFVKVEFYSGPIPAYVAIA